MTLRPLGPSVTRTALASVSMPDSILSRASDEKRTCLAAMMMKLLKKTNISAAMGRIVRGRSAGENAHDVGFLHDQKLLTINLNFRARPFAEQHLVALLDVHRRQLARLVAPAGSDGDNFAFLRLLLGVVGNDDTALGLLLAFKATNDDAVVQWVKFHGARFRSMRRQRQGGMPMAPARCVTSNDHGPL